MILHEGELLNNYKINTSLNINMKPVSITLTLLIALTNACYPPKQIHLSLTERDYEMRVTWIVYPLSIT